MSVCHENAYFPYSKDFVVSPVYRHFTYSRYFVISPVYRHQKESRNSKTTKSLEIITFQGVWSFLLFLDTFRRLKICITKVVRYEG